MTYVERMDMEQLETMLVTEIAIVLGDDPRGLVSALHALHAVDGAFRSDPRRRKPDPPPPPLPRDPFRYAGHEYRGAFAVKSGELVLGDPVMSMLVVHESIARKPDAARAEAITSAKLWVDSGQVAALDAAIRDDAAFDDAIHLGADVNGITGGRGCFHPSGGGDGSYPLWVHTTGGAADLIVIDFAGESRDLLIDARKRLLRR